MKALIPYEYTPLSDPFHVEAEIYIDGPDTGLLEYRITGPLDQLIFPDPTLVESRRDELWKSTCLEAFFTTGTAAEDSYLELNCAPNGDWNAYEFTSYRQGMVTSANSKIRLIHREGSAEEVLFRIRLESPLLKHMKWASLTTVLQHQDGSVTYWALKHSRTKPDFHDKDTFIAPL
ncbi:hypothetical protein D3C87_1601640 [compost metagenome]